MMSVNCAIYARYSSDLQKETSIEDQIRNCRAGAGSKGMTVLEDHIYSDKAISGSSLNGRVQLELLLENARRKRRPFDYVLVDDTSRLSRNKLDQMTIIDELHSLGIYLLFVSQNIDTADEQAEDVILPIHGIVDNLYLKELAKKTQRGMAGQVLQGYSPGGRTYGYTYTPVEDPSGVIDKRTRQVRVLGTTISVNEKQARVIRRVFELYVDGLGLRAIADILNREGIEPSGSSNQRRKYRARPSWCPTAIRYLLQNRKYIGDFTWNKHKWYKNRRTGKRARRERPESEWIKHYDESLALVPESLFKAAQARFSKNRAAYYGGRRAPKRQYLFSGLLKCEICGGSFISVGERSSGNPNYGCSLNWHRGGSVCTNNVRIRKSILEHHLLEAIRTQIIDSSAIAEAVDVANQKLRTMIDRYSESGSDVERRIEQVEREIENLTTFIANTGNASDAVQVALASKEAELRELGEAASQAKELHNFSEFEVDYSYVKGWFAELPELLKEDMPLARARLARMTDRIELKPIRRGKRGFLSATGYANVAGILGLSGNSSTRCISGGRI
jgi:DNA invertase Pin-like site-specific DNA recombinase